MSKSQRRLCNISEISDAELVEDLQDLAAQWTSLATGLEISPMTQDTIKGEGSPTQNRFQGVVKEWLWGVKMAHTKKFLVEALGKEAVGEPALASRIDGDEGKVLL